MTKMTL